MDAQYPFASREDIWRVQEEVKDLYATQLEYGERISKLERRKEDDARMKSLWGPFSPFPSSAGNPAHQESSFNSPAEPFKGFDQGHHHGLTNNIGLENDEEPRRGASRANSVRFDESSMHGYYSHANRSATDLAPTRTRSGLGSHPLTERSLSHRSEDRQSSSGQSHRTYSLGLETARNDGSTTATTISQHPLQPPPGLFILGPVPCIIRCWLTTHFSNDSLLYAAVCSASYSSAVSYEMIQKLGLENDITERDGVKTIKLPVYLPEASVYQSSSRSGSPDPHLPALTVRFQVRETDHGADKVIQIFLGSDVLRSHNADILFSQDKMLIMDDERNRISIPLVRPENNEAFNSLATGPQKAASRGSVVNDTIAENGTPQVSGRGVTTAGGFAKSRSPSPRKSALANLPLRTSSDSFEGNGKPRSARFVYDSEDNSPNRTHTESAAGDALDKPAKNEGPGAWGSWRREPVKAEPAPYLAAASQRPSRARNMKVLRPSKPLSSSRQVSTSSVSDVFSSRFDESSHKGSQFSGSEGTEGSVPKPLDSSRHSKTRSTNPVGGASAFGWLNTNQGKQNSGAD